MVPIRGTYYFVLLPIPYIKEVSFHLGPRMPQLFSVNEVSELLLGGEGIRSINHAEDCFVKSRAFPVPLLASRRG